LELELGKSNHFPFSIKTNTPIPRETSRIELVLELSR
jgi:hypothetical protein